MNKKILYLFIFLSFSSLNLFGSGFQLNEHGAKAMSLGGAFTAIANDPSAIYFNGAGIINLSGFNLMLGTTLIFSDASFRGPYPSIVETKMEKQVFYPSHFYATYQANDKLFLGLGFNTPFGLGTEWNENWVGRFVSVKIDLQTFSFNPTIAYKFNENISASVGLLYNFANVTIIRNVNLSPFNAEAQINIDGDDNSAFGFNAGLLIKANDKLSFGASYRSEVEYNFDGTVKSRGPSQFSELLPQGSGKSKLVTPQQFTIGIAYKFLDKFLISSDFQYVFWSSYDSLNIDFNNSDIEDSKSPRLYDNSYFIRFGLEYILNEKLALRGGLFFDKNPIKDEYLDATIPDADRLGFNLGFGYDLSNKISLDVAYLFLRFEERTINNSKISYSGNDGFLPFNGTYNSFANLVSMSLSYKF